MIYLSTQMTHHEPTIFDKIISGEIPCHRVYEDDLVLAFLDINPLSPGHLLVIPKERAAQLHLLSDEAAAATVPAAPKIPPPAPINAVGAMSICVAKKSHASDECPYA